MITPHSPPLTFKASWFKSIVQSDSFDFLYRFSGIDAITPIAKTDSRLNLLGISRRPTPHPHPSNGSSEQLTTKKWSAT